MLMIITKLTKILKGLLAFIKFALHLFKLVCCLVAIAKDYDAGSRLYLVSWAVFLLVNSLEGKPITSRKRYLDLTNSRLGMWNEAGLKLWGSFKPNNFSTMPKPHDDEE